MTHKLIKKKKIVEDKSRNLIWQHDISNDEVDWISALQLSEQCCLCDLDGWRLPTIGELQSLLCKAPDERGFHWENNLWNYSGRGSWFWSSTEDEDGNVKYVAFSTGETGSIGKNEKLQYVFVHDLLPESKPEPESEPEPNIIVENGTEIKPETSSENISDEIKKEADESKTGSGILMVPTAHGGIFYFCVYSIVFVLIFAALIFFITPSMKTADVIFQARKISSVFEKYAKSAYRKHAEQGDRIAKTIYENWEEYKKLDDSDTSLKSTMVKAWNGDEKSQFDLAAIYERHENSDEALRWYKKAAENKNEEAVIIVDNWEEYRTFDLLGDRFRQNQIKALQGDAAAQLVLGNFYYNGDITERNKNLACKWWLKASEKGLAEAQYKTGNCYEAGIISEKKETIKEDDRKEDKKSPKKAKTKKEEPKNDIEPMKSWLKAAEQGYAEAQNKIADCYYYGKCRVGKSERNARKWLEKSAGNGNEEARKKLVEWFLEDIRWSDKSSEALSWYNAEKYCEDLKEKGFSDWRLPTIDELRTLIQNRKTIVGGECQVSYRNGCLSPDCWSLDSCVEACSVGNCSVFDDGRYSKIGDGDIWFWSSSSKSFSTDEIWGIGFGKGDISTRYKSDSSHVRCVR